MRNTKRLQLRNAKIKAEYERQKAKKKHTVEYIQQKLADKYFLSVGTIQNIVYK